MQQITDFFSKNKKECLSVLILTVFFLICTIISWGSFGNLYYDCGREMLLPEAILKSGGGNILYKDIFAMYNPLSYQINALLYTVFGISITTLQAAGATFLILLSLYTVARLFINRFYSLTICILISSLYIFAQISCVNYLFPYAYAFIYALLGFMAFIVLTLFYIKYDNKR